MNLKNIFFLVLCSWLNAGSITAQEQPIADSLVQVYRKGMMHDTSKMALLVDLSFNEIRDFKKGLRYAEELIKLAKQTGNDNYLRMGYHLAGTKKRIIGPLDEALEYYFKSADLSRKLNKTTAEAETYGAIADIYSTNKNHGTASAYYTKAIGVLRHSGNAISLASALSNAGDEFRKREKYDSALLYLEEAKIIFEKENYSSGTGYVLGNIGMLYASIGKDKQAESYMNEAIRILDEAQDYSPICSFLTSLADLYIKKGDKKTAMNYSLTSFRLAMQHGLKAQVAEASLKLSQLNEAEGNTDEAYQYYKMHVAYNDSVNNIKTVQEMADLRTEYEVAQKQVEVNRLSQQKRDQKNMLLFLAIILGFSILIGVILFGNNRHKQKAYAILEVQKQKTEAQQLKAEGALGELQVTQKLLVQSAKMASLGELTAGIAHEIQNPLNFVNNFSEISVELLGELREGTVSKLTSTEKAEAGEIMNILADNLKKIGEHGKRADAIVKGMLLHSRASTGKKEPTDINALADEYLRLSYNGLRVKDNTFSAKLNTNFDMSLSSGETGVGKIDVVPQDIGRVFLNLFNNAFYSLYKKSRAGIDGFEPAINITTKKNNTEVIITVYDNGMGITEQICEKIFQPFFTTKPTGEGTGLGLSLSYDIVTAHGGSLMVESKEGEYAEFTMRLPAGKILVT